MVTVYNTFEGIASGVAISVANSGGLSGNAFNAVAGSPPTADNAHAHSGIVSMHSNAAGAAQYVDWTATTFTPAAPIYARMYLYITANPSASLPVIAYRTASAGAGGSLVLNTSGVPVLSDAAGSTAWTGTALGLNQWHRIETYSTGGTTGADATIEARIYSGANLETWTASQGSGQLTGKNGGTLGPPVLTRFGITTAITASEWLDDVAGSTDGWLGPSVSLLPQQIRMRRAALPTRLAGREASAVYGR